MELHKARYNYRQATKRDRGKKFLILFLGFVLIVIGGGGYSAAAITKDHQLTEPTRLEYPGYTPEKVDINWPGVGQAAFGTTDDGLLGSTQNEKVQPIASITKLVTALTVLKENPLNTGEQGDIYTMNSVDEQLFDEYISKLGSVVPVRSGLKLSQYDMLNALLLPSANNIADSLVVRTFGTKQKYIEAANIYVSSLGLEQTVISDASGFSPKSVSTPSEVLIIAGEALKNPVMAEIMAKQTYDFPGWGEIKNSNQLLGSRKGIIGLKTGTTDEAGYCLVFAETHTIGPETVTIVGSVLGGTSRAGLYGDVQSLLDSVEKGFRQIDIAKKDTVVARIDSPWGEYTDIVVSEDLSVFGWIGASYQTEVELSSQGQNVLRDEGVGVISVVGTSQATEVTTKTAINEPNVWWRLQNVF